METDKALAAASGRLGDAYKSVTGADQKVALDPSLIIMLVELALTVLTQCYQRGGLFGVRKALTGSDVKERAKRPGLAREFFVRRLVRDRLQEDFGPGAWREKDGPKVVEAIFKAGAEAEPVEIDALIKSALVADES